VTLFVTAVFTKYGISCCFIAGLGIARSVAPAYQLPPQIVYNALDSNSMVITVSYSKQRQRVLRAEIQITATKLGLEGNSLCG